MLCAGTEECGDDLVCSPDRPGLPSVCKPRGEPGEFCLNDSHCRQDLVCDTDRFEPMCRLPDDDIRRVPVPVECFDDADCDSTERCVEDVQGRTQCQEGAPVGAPCIDQPCAEGLVCRGDHTIGNRTCRAELGDVGSRCFVDVDCLDELLCIGPAGDRFCTRDPLPASSCFRSSLCRGERVCRPTLSCEEPSCEPELGPRRCQEEGQRGEVCHSDLHCRPDLACRWGTEFLRCQVAP